MKAIVVREFGEPEFLRYEDAPDPKIGAGEVLVRVRAVGVNFADHLMRRGAYRGQEPPLIPGLELAGEVAMVGPSVNDLTVGQRVFGWARDTYAELAAVPAAKVLPIPERLSFEQAAGVPTVFGTAWACLSSLAKLQPGERVLVHAAGSGVGSAAIQVAKALGGWVVTTAGDEWKLERARQLGADATINYKAVGDGLATEVSRLTDGRGVDVVLEGVGRATFATSVQALAPMGRMVIYGSPSGARVELDTRLAIFKNLTIYGLAITTEPRTQQTIDDFRAGALPLFEQQRLSPVIHRVLPLQQAAEAHRMLLERSQFGKLVLTV
jgi:NADPH2:quinone reductase